MIENNTERIVIDSGPDFRQQMLRENVHSLDAVIFTHEHKDHIAGLDDVRAFNYLHKKSMDVYATVRVQEALKREFHYIFSGDTYPGIPRLKVHTIDQSPFYVNSFNIIPVPVMHLNLSVLGFRIGDFTYITDANFIDDESKDLIRGSKVLVLNALRKEKHVSHFNLEEARAPPHAGAAVEVHQQAAPAARDLLHAKVAIQGQGLGAGDGIHIGVEVLPAGLGQGQPGLGGKHGDHPAQEVGRGAEVGVEDGHELAGGRGQPGRQGAGLEAGAVGAVEQTDGTAARAMVGHAGPDDGGGVVGGIVQHLEGQALAGVVERGGGVDELFSDVALIEERELHQDGRPVFGAGGQLGQGLGQAAPAAVGQAERGQEHHVHAEDGHEG